MKETIKQIKISENDILTWFKKIGQEAEEKGLTEELLDELLADES